MSKDDFDKIFDEKEEPNLDDEEPGTTDVDQAPPEKPVEEPVEEPAEEQQLKFPFDNEDLDPSLPKSIDFGSKTIMMNFDGVIHDTKIPWEKREEIKGPAVEGVFKAMRKYHEYGFHLHVCSSRAGSQAGVTAIFNFMQEKGIFKKVLHALSISDKVVPFIVFIGDTGFSIDDGFPSINTIMLEDMKKTTPVE